MSTESKQYHEYGVSVTPRDVFVVPGFGVDTTNPADFSPSNPNYLVLQPRAESSQDVQLIINSVRTESRQSLIDSLPKHLVRMAQTLLDDVDSKKTKDQKPVIIAHSLGAVVSLIAVIINPYFADIIAVSPTPIEENTSPHELVTAYMETILVGCSVKGQDTGTSGSRQLWEIVKRKIPFIQKSFNDLVSQVQAVMQVGIRPIMSEIKALQREMITFNQDAPDVVFVIPIGDPMLPKPTQILSDALFQGLPTVVVDGNHSFELDELPISL